MSGCHNNQQRFENKIEIALYFNRKRIWSFRINIRRNRVTTETLSVSLSRDNRIAQYNKIVARAKPFLNSSLLTIKIRRLKSASLIFYLCTLPEPSPPASFSTSLTLTLLKSPSIECLRADAATANSIAPCESLPLRRA